MDINLPKNKDEEFIFKKTISVLELFLSLKEKLLNRQIFYSEKEIFLTSEEMFYINAEDSSIEFFVKCKFLTESKIEEKYISILTISDEENICENGFWIAMYDLRFLDKFSFNFSYGIQYDRTELYLYKIEIKNWKPVNIWLEREI